MRMYYFSTATGRALHHDVHREVLATAGHQLQAYQVTDVRAKRDIQENS